MTDTKAKKYGVYDQDATANTTAGETSMGRDASRSDAAKKRAIPWVWIAVAIVVLIILALILF